MIAEDVFKSPQFAELSEQQQSFLRELAGNGWNKVAAAKAAWKCKDDRSATAMADRALRNPKIAGLVALIDPAKARMTREEGLEIFAKFARTSDDPGIAIKCVQLIGKWEGWEKEPSTVPDEEEDIYAQAAKLKKE